MKLTRWFLILFLISAGLGLLTISACSNFDHNLSAQSAERSNPQSAQLNQNNGANSPSAVVKALKANLRNKPSRSGAVVTLVEKNDRLTLLAPTPTGPWYQVRKYESDAEGWIHGSSITLEQSTVTVTPSTPRSDSIQQVKSAPQRISGRSYINVDGERVPSPVFTDTRPAGASARCRDGSYSFSRNRRGTCSHHGGVAVWF